MTARKSYTSKPAEPFPFDLDGVAFVVPGGVSLLDLCEMARLADVDATSPEGAAALADFFHDALGDGYERFRLHVREHHTDPGTLVDIMADMIEATTARPTRRPSDSSDGPTTTGPTLRVISSDGTVREEQLTPQRVAQLRAEAEGEAATG